MLIVIIAASKYKELLRMNKQLAKSNSKLKMLYNEKVNSIEALTVDGVKMQIEIQHVSVFEVSVN